MQFSYSLHKIHDQDSITFEPADYSKFKYGDNAIARRFGEELARGFINDWLTDHPISKQIVVFSSPFSFIPTATQAMTTSFMNHLNRWLAQNEFPVVQSSKIHRTVTYKEDYGDLDAEQRMKLIGNDRFHIDASFLKDKFLLFLDDIRITGSHERMINRTIGEHNLQNDSCLLYFAQLTNDTIHPRIENYLNNYLVKSIFDLEEIIQGELVMNTRLVKFILDSNENDFQLFIQNKPESFLMKLYDLALGNSYHLMESYKPNLLFLGNNLLKTAKQTN